MVKGEYYKDFTFDLAEALGDKKRKTSTPKDKSDTAVPLIENTSLNIDVEYKEPFVVDNNIAFILVEPNVNISGTATNPIITRIRDWTIHLKISGKTDNLKFQLFSEPAESHEDILSLLIAGKTTKELGGGGGGSYTNILTDKAADIIGKSVEESTPLDSFKVGHSGSEGSNVSVTLGKKLSKRLEVTYSMETEDQETVQTNAAEYRILENVMLKAFNDSKGDFGTEVILKLEFR
jgi:translocation and assembly module TamB